MQHLRAIDIEVEDFARAETLDFGSELVEAATLFHATLDIDHEAVEQHWSTFCPTDAPVVALLPENKDALLLRYAKRFMLQRTIALTAYRLSAFKTCGFLVQVV